MNIKKIAFITMGLFAIYAGVVVAISNQETIKSELESVLSQVPTQSSSEVASDSSVTPHVGGEQTIVKDSAVAATNSAADLTQLENAPKREPTVNEILNNELFRNAITLGLGLFAFMQWINYFASFDPGRALAGVIAPAMATFLSFKWTEVLSWFLIM